MNNPTQPSPPASQAHAAPNLVPGSPVPHPQPHPHHHLAGDAAPAVSEKDLQLQRIKRIGKSLFDVANCVVKFDGEMTAFPTGARSMAAMEEAFCDGLPLSASLLLVPDARNDPTLAQHRLVVGAPYIRFIAAQPVFNEEHLPIGSITLLGYAPRNFSDEERQLLSDLASVVERELRLNTVTVAQQDLLKKNRTLRRESLVDPVIGTWNRAAITRILATEVERCHAEAKPLSLVFVDLDALKRITENFGLPAADNILLKFASRLRSCIRPSDALGRYEGEKFLVVLPGASHASAMVVAERIRQAIITPPEHIGEAVINLIMSAGTASTDLFASATMDELLGHADRAQRRAKQAGRNQIMQAAPVSSDIDLLT